MISNNNRRHKDSSVYLTGRRCREHKRVLQRQEERDEGKDRREEEQRCVIEADGSETEQNTKRIE